VLQSKRKTTATAATQPVARAEKSTPADGRTHVVRRGDTLYGISRASGVSVADLARANNLAKPYELNVGDKLVVPGDGTPALAQKRAPTPVLASIRPAKPRAETISLQEPAELVAFEWPVKGAIVGEFDPGLNGPRNDGVDIAAPVGTPVRAAADGEVVYRGSELEGYGNLLLIKHDDGFVTAYAHNDAMLVRKGQKVRQGQVIAKVGQTGGAEQPKLHFEIRQDLKAVNPLDLLGS